MQAQSHCDMSSFSKCRMLCRIVSLAEMINTVTVTVIRREKLRCGEKLRTSNGLQHALMLGDRRLRP